jgi:tetratricopeptide (TPR) repeat protein
MGKRSRQKRLSRQEAGTASPSAPSPTHPRRAAAKPSPRRWLARLALVVLSPTLAVFLTEGVLRLAGFGYSTRYFEEQPGQTPRTLTTNPQVAWQYYSRETATTPTPVLFPSAKAPGAKRVFVLGESAAAGTPDPAFGFARILEVMLRQQYPSNRLEVINAAMRGINSHVVLPIARECAALAPDLFVVYMGNNETIGLHAPSPNEFNLTPYPRLLRLLQWAKATRVYQLAQAGLNSIRSQRPNPRQDIDYMRSQRLAFDDPKRTAVYSNFQRNLHALLGVIRDAGARGVVASVAVNVADFAPLGSLHRSDLGAGPLAEWEKHYADGVAAASAKQFELALARFQAALGLDDHHAELHYRLGQCARELGQFDLARRHLLLARDWDALQFRADSRLNGIVRAAAGQRQSEGLQFVDLENTLAGEDPTALKLPGREQFHEHVHFTFAGDYQTARLLMPAVTAALGLPPPVGPLPARDECARVLAFTPIDDLNVRSAMAVQTSKPPFVDQADHAARQGEMERGLKDELNRTTMAHFEQASSVYREAMTRRPDDWMLHLNYANLLAQFGQYAPSLPEYQFVLQRLPRQRSFRMMYGNALLQAKRPGEAIAQFEEILKADSRFQPARDGIAAAAARVRGR